MATFVQIEPDAFNQVNKDVGAAYRQGNALDGEFDFAKKYTRYHHVRRPVRGIQVKDDTYATIQVRQSNGEPIPLFDAAAHGDTGKGDRNSNFIVQSIQEQRAEKQQIILTFGEPYIFFFGEQPRMITVSGILLNTEDFNWRAEWWENYERFLRGTQCVRQKARMYLAWDDIVVEGYITSANASEDASNRNLVQFNFQMFLTNYQNVSSIGDVNAHWNSKEIDLNPDDIDILGSTELSSTAAVRLRNVISEKAEAGRGKGTLFDFLRSGNIAQAANQVVELQGQVVDFLSLAGQFVSGRNIRVPIGFEGAAAFDQEVQLALSSIPGSRTIINGSAEGRAVTLRTGGLGLIKEFRAVLGSRFGPARVGLPLSANEDEFVAIIQQDISKGFNGLFAGQTTQDADASDTVRRIFEDLGIEVDPPSELTLLFRRVGFGIVSLAAGANLLDSSSLRSGLNTIGTVL